MQPNKYTVDLAMLVHLQFTIIASSSEEAENLVRAHVAELQQDQWRAAHAKPGIQRIDELDVKAGISSAVVQAGS